MFGIAYGEKMHMAPAPTGEPGNAPASYISAASAATIWPSFLAPIFTLMCDAGVGPVASNSSIRLMMIFTGLPDLRDNTAATGSRYTEILPPKPPPISHGVTDTRDTGSPRISAAWRCTTKAPCVLVQMYRC